MITTFFWILAILGLFSIVGYCCTEILCRLCKRELTFQLEYMAIFAFIGLCVTELFSFLMCFIWFNSFLVYGYIFGFCGLFAYWILVYKKSQLIQIKEYFIKNRRIIAFFLITFLFIVIFFTMVNEQIQTSPNGDALDHNAVISMIIANSRFPSNYAPIDPDIAFSITRYPPGFRTLGAFITLMTFQYPVLATPLLASTISIILLFLIFSTIYLKSKSVFSGLIGVLFALILPRGTVTPPFDGNDLLLGNLINGTYPNHLVVMQIIGMFAVFIFNEGIKDERAVAGRQKALPLILISLVGISIVLSHYLFAYFAGVALSIELGAVIFKRLRGFLTRQKDKKKKILLLGILTMIVVGALGTIILVYPRVYEYLTTRFQHGFVIIAVEPSYFVENILGFLVMVSLALFVVKSIILKKWVKSDIFYAIFAVTIILMAVNPQLEAYIFITAYRCVIPLVGIAIIQIMLDVHAIGMHLREKTRFQVKLRIQLSIRVVREGKQNWEKTATGTARTFETILILILITCGTLFVPMYRRNSERNWLGPGTDEYFASKWIVENINQEDVILNDPSFPGLYITSFDWKNVVFLRQLSAYEGADGDIYNTDYAQRAHAGMEILTHPDSYFHETANAIVEQYNISYIYLTGDRFYYDYFRGGYNQKTGYTMDYYIEVFGQNPYLVQEFRRGNAVVYSTHIKTPAEIFRATYNFANVTPGSIPQGWEISADERMGVFLRDRVGRHARPLELYDANAAHPVVILNRFSPQPRGTIELWFRVTSADNCLRFVVGNEGLQQNLYVYANFGFKYNGGSHISLKDSLENNLWHHLRLEFDCPTGKFNCYLNGVPLGTGLDILGGTTSHFSWLMIDTFHSYNPVKCYIDAVGYSWDPTYSVGDNLEFED